MPHLSNKTNYGKLRPYVRLNGFGDIIPGSIVFRTSQPKQGIWRELGFINACCSGIGDSYLIIQNNSADTDITSIISSDGRINHTTALEDGDIMVFVIPNGINETVTLTMSAPGADINVVATTAQGDGTIEADPDAIVSGVDPVTSILTTSATPNSQYLVVIEND